MICTHHIKPVDYQKPKVRRKSGKHPYEKDTLHTEEQR